jgi:hypothetical protein
MDNYMELLIYGILLLVVVILGLMYYKIRNEKVANFIKKILDFIQGC